MTKCEEAIYSNEFEDFIVSSEEGAKNLLDNSNPICYIPAQENFISLYTSKGLTSSSSLLNYSSVPYLYGLMSENNLSNYKNTYYALPSPVPQTGKGVLIGIISTGIDYTLPEFTNKDNTSKILYIWDQTTPSGKRYFRPDYGSEYSREDINKSLLDFNSSTASTNSFSPLTTDDNGQGTFLAGITSGFPSDTSPFSGIAPDSNLVIVKLKDAKEYLKDFYRIPTNTTAYQENDILLAINYMVDISTFLNRPIVICLGLGTNLGDHNGNSALSRFCNGISRRRGICLCVSGGNEGISRHHYRGNLLPDSSYEDVEIKVGENESGFTLELWTLSSNLLSVGIFSPSGEFTGKIPARINSSADLSFIFEETKASISYELIETFSGDELIVIKFTSPKEGTWTIRVFNEEVIDGFFDCWLPINGFISSETYFLKPDPDITLCEPSNAESIISCSGYNSINNSIYVNSSRGPTRAEDIKPDLSAPAINIISPTGRTYTGTDASAGICAGQAALLFQWGIVDGNLPAMTGLELKKILIRGAIRNPRLTYPNKEWGWGRVDIYNAFLSLR